MTLNLTLLALFAIGALSWRGSHRTEDLVVAWCRLILCAVCILLGIVGSLMMWHLA